MYNVWGIVAVSIVLWEEGHMSWYYMTEPVYGEKDNSD